MSGGVDSAVAAQLLVEAGHDVFGVTLKLWCYGDRDAGPRSCCSLSAIEDARATCDVLGIRHYVLDFEDRFTERVVDRFVDEYLAGRTPNPCVLCNQHVKFGALLEKARAAGADRVATGHYARLFETPDGVELRRGVDPDKDQSYALWSVERDVLRHTMLPIGAYTKDEIRAHARRGGIPVAEKIDSQDICFVPDGDYARFVELRAGERTGRSAARPVALRAGSIRHVDGSTLGEHRGVAHYTIGQRRGLGISHDEPLYVVGLDASDNVVTVGPRDALASAGFVGRDVNWVSCEPPSEPLRVSAKIRYRHAGAPGTLELRSDGRVAFRFDSPGDSVTPGQSAAFYDGDRVVGGAVIASAIPENARDAARSGHANGTPNPA